jgi:hypothetical protein
VPRTDHKRDEALQDRDRVDELHDESDVEEADGGDAFEDDLIEDDELGAEDEGDDAIVPDPSRWPVSGDEEVEDGPAALGDYEDPVPDVRPRVKPVERGAEFVCRRCFLVKKRSSQLADPHRMLCRDCV